MVGVLADDTDPMVTVMKLDKAPQETYADIGGLDTQIQEIKVGKLQTRRPELAQMTLRAFTSVLFQTWSFFL